MTYICHILVFITVNEWAFWLLDRQPLYLWLRRRSLAIFNKARGRVGSISRKFMKMVKNQNREKHNSNQKYLRQICFWPRWFQKSKQLVKKLVKLGFRPIKAIVSTFLIKFLSLFLCKIDSRFLKKKFPSQVVKTLKIQNDHRNVKFFLWR